MHTLLFGDALEQLKTLQNNSIDSLVTDPPAAIGFANINWDKNKGGRENWIAWLTSVMVEAHRVLKPGSHGFVWAIPRTSHWTMMALEDAGFEIRDVITHHFSGFSKSSMNVSKAIDKSAGAERKIISSVKLVGNSSKLTGGNYGGNGNNKQERSFQHITEPATDAAKKWDGWGTALKPATEFWILVRKPLDGTVVSNVNKHGVGAINIDESRIKFGKDEKINPEMLTNPLGRFPSNMILSHDDECGKICMPGCPVEELSKQHKTAKRYFYIAKPSQSERNAGCEDGNSHPTVKGLQLMTYLIKMVTPEEGTILDCFMGSGSTGVAAVQNNFNFIGIELEEASINTARSRIEFAQQQIDV